MRLLFALLATTAAFNKDSIEDCSRVLSEYLLETFERVSGEQKLIQFYEKFVEAEQYDPRVELKRSKAVIEKYLKRRGEFAFKAKVSLEERDMKNSSDIDVNDPNSKDFIRFMSAKQGNDATIIYAHSHIPQQKKVNATRTFTFDQNANFYSLSTSPVASAVHIPTPLYDRQPELLKKIEWSEIDAVYRTHRDEVRDLAFQLFCSESGYMRFYPAASWYWDSEKEHLDLFDCRNTEWYINAATNSKNVLIMLDMSGSMLGQRYEIAKQTTEAILETLSHNDYFNIMPFSKSTAFLDDCKGERGLLQATMRNKKLLRSKMNNITSGDKAEYEVALPTAFTTLLNLPNTWTIHTKEEFALLLQTNQTDDRRYRELPEHFLGYTKEYELAISQSNGRSDQGCENVIMLITDGAPSTYKEIFDMYNKDKKVRVFSFLIGEEAIDFEQVKHIACNNRGFMVHVQNMADVEEKVQHYIRTMSRSIGIHASDIGPKDALWTGVYRERLYLPRPSGEVFAEPVPITNQSYAVMNKMASKRKIRLQKTFARSRMFVTTVSFPVIVNQTFMGVAAVNIPLTELRQLAHPTNIGGKSYFFMMDQNGFIMFHPQLRSIDPYTKYHKPNYNNMDILELEVPQTQQIRLAQPKELVSNYHCERASYAECVHEIRQITKRMILKCDNSEPQELDILFANEVVDRVWPQTNIYYAECIEGANFVLGLAVAKGDDYRLRRRTREYNYGAVRLDWMNDKQWRIHSHWRYCLLNDTDANMTKEEAFQVYAKQMAESGKLPELCKPRHHLVDKLLVDLEATSAVQEIWDQQWQFMQENSIHLVFFTSPSGLIRFYNNTLDDYDYLDPNWNILDHIGSMLSMDHVQESYNHFIADLYAKSVDDPYFKRSVRMRGDIVFDVSNKSKIWYKSETHYTNYGHNENLTMLSQATKAIYTGNALLGVAGYEFAYDYMVKVMSDHGCPPSDEKKWCVLLDEHGYVYYSNDKDILYENYLEDPIGKGRHIGHWFGDINRVSQRAMALLVEKKFYTKLRYIDHQAICKEKKMGTQSANSNKPFRWLFRSLWSFSLRLLQSLRSFSLVPLFFSHSEAYTNSFHDVQDGVPCAKASYFYYANKQGRRPVSTSLVDGGRYERPCPTTKCSVRMQASFVEGTNLIMVWLTQEDSSSLCYDESACPLLDPGEVPFGFERQDPPDPVPETCDMPPHKRPPSSKAMCYNAINEELALHEPCSPATMAVLSLLPALLGLLL